MKKKGIFSLLQLNKISTPYKADADKVNLYYDNNVKIIDENSVVKTLEDQSNKENTTLDTSTTKYPTNNLVKTSIDAKVEDQITDGVTTKAPSQNAVFDALALKLNTSLKGANNGLAELGSDGKVPSSQLPAYVDDVLEYTDFASFPATGETGKIYIALDTNIIYRWSGSIYVVIGSSLALGETSSTAYRGDRGKIAYDHSQLTSGNPHNVTKSDVGLGNVDNTSDLNKPISTATQTALDSKQTLPSFTDNAGKTYKIKDDETGIEMALPIETLTTTQRDALTNLTTNLIIYNSTDSTLQKYNGSTWDNIGGSGGGSWGSITGTLSDQIDLQSILDTKLDDPYSIVDITSVILGSAPSSYSGLLAFATDTGLVYRSNGTSWNNVNGAGSTIKNDFNLGHIPTTTDNASQGFSVGSQASVNAEGDIYTLVSFSGTDANWITNASVNFVDDKATFEGINWLNLPTGEITYANQVFQIANANGMVITGTNTGGGAVFSNGETAIYTVNSSGTGYSFTSKVSSGGSSSITVDSIITQAQNKSSLPAGNYITTVAFSDGMPAGISINDIFNKSSAGAYTLVSTYANYKTASIQAGSGNSAQFWVKNNGTWVSNHYRTAVCNTSISAGDLVKINSTAKLEKAVSVIGGAGTDIISQTSASVGISRTSNGGGAGHLTVDTNVVLQYSINAGVKLKLGIVNGDNSISWGPEYTTTLSSAQFVRASCVVVSGSYFALASNTSSGTQITVSLFQFNGNEIIAEKVLASPSSTGSACYSYGLSSLIVSGSYVLVLSTVSTLAAANFRAFTITITSLNGASSTATSVLSDNATSGNPLESTSVNYGRSLRGIVTGLNSEALIFFARTGGYVDARAYTVTTTLTGRSNFTNILSNGAEIKPVQVAPTEVAGKVILLHQSTNSATSVIGNNGSPINGGASTMFLNLIDTTAGAALVRRTTFASAENSIPLPVPVGLTMPSNAAMGSITYLGNNVYTVTYSLSASGSASTTLYSATFSIDPVNNLFLGWAVNPANGFYYRVITTTATTPTNSSYHDPSQWVSSIAGGRGVFCFADSSNTYSISASIVQYGNATVVDYNNFVGVALQSASANGTIMFASNGQYAALNQSLTPGVNYYLQADGTISSTVSTYRVGRAISDKVILLSTLLLTNASPFVNTSINNGSGSFATFTDLTTNVQDNLLRIYSWIADQSQLIAQVIGEDFLVSNSLRTKHIIGDGGTPSISLSTGAGTSPTVSISGNDIAGFITITTGTTPAGTNALIGTITFSKAYTVAPSVILTPGNRNANLLNGVNQVLVPVSGQTNGVTTTNFKIESGSTALSASTVYIWKYQIIQ